jgi:hypothetical protein
MFELTKECGILKHNIIQYRFSFKTINFLDWISLYVFVYPT